MKSNIFYYIYSIIFFWLAPYLIINDCADEIIDEFLIWQPGDYRLEILFIFQDHYETPMGDLVAELRAKYFPRFMEMLNMRFNGTHKLGAAKFSRDRKYCDDCPMVANITTNVARSLQQLRDYTPTGIREPIESAQLENIIACLSRAIHGWHWTDIIAPCPCDILKVAILFTDLSWHPQPNQPPLPSCYRQNVTDGAVTLSNGKITQIIFAWHTIYHEWYDLIRQLTIHSDFSTRGIVIEYSPILRDDVYRYMMDGLKHIARYRPYHIHYNLTTPNDKEIKHIEVVDDVMTTRTFLGPFPPDDCLEKMKNSDLELHISIPGTNLMEECQDLHDFQNLYKQLVSLKKKFKSLKYGISFHSSPYFLCDEGCVLKLEFTENLDILLQPTLDIFKKDCATTIIDSQTRDALACVKDERLNWLAPKPENTQRFLMLVTSNPIIDIPKLELPETNRKYWAPGKLDRQCGILMADVFGLTLKNHSIYPIVIGSKKHKALWKPYFQYMRTHGIADISSGIIDYVRNTDKYIEDIICEDMVSPDYRRPTKSYAEKILRPWDEIKSFL